METDERRRQASGVLAVLAVLLAFGGFLQGASAYADIVRAIYFSAAAILIGMALVVWAAA
jgi:hypothetical protein